MSLVLDSDQKHTVILNRALRCAAWHHFPTLGNVCEHASKTGKVYSDKSGCETCSVETGTGSVRAMPCMQFTRIRERRLSLATGNTGEKRCANLQPKSVDLDPGDLPSATNTQRLLVEDNNG